MNPRVTVILTTFERPMMLQRAIDSVLAQTYDDFELIIVDDNSRSSEQEAILIMNESNPKIRIIRTDVLDENRLKTTRYATCINIALAEAKGEYITYLCDDDYYMPQRLEKMVGFLNANPDKGVVYGSQQIERNGEKAEIRKASAVLDNADCVVDHSSVMHRKVCAEMVGGWEDAPEHWGHGDGVFWKKLGDKGFKFYPIDEVLDCHVYHDGSWTKKVGEINKARNN